MSGSRCGCEDGRVLDLTLAQQLRAAGLSWEPVPGDRFVLPLPEMQGEGFILSNIVADVNRFEGGNVSGFNGTTEWALDSVEQDDVVWLPREEQLRELLAQPRERRLRAAFTLGQRRADRRHGNRKDRTHPRRHPSRGRPADPSRWSMHSRPRKMLIPKDYGFQRIC